VQKKCFSARKGGGKARAFLCCVSLSHSQLEFDHLFEVEDTLATSHSMENLVYYRD